MVGVVRLPNVPMSNGVTAVSAPRPGARRRATGARRGGWVPAPTEFPPLGLAALPFSGSRLAAKGPAPRHDHPRRAEAALHGACFQERLLQRMELAARFQS